MLKDFVQRTIGSDSIETESHYSSVNHLEEVTFFDFILLPLLHQNNARFSQQGRK